jgi:hypothetical protein
LDHAGWLIMTWRPFSRTWLGCASSRCGATESDQHTDNQHPSATLRGVVSPPVEVLDDRVERAVRLAGESDVIIGPVECARLMITSARSERPSEADGPERGDERVRVAQLGAYPVKWDMGTCLSRWLAVVRRAGRRGIGRAAGPPLDVERRHREPLLGVDAEVRSEPRCRTGAARG